MSAPLIRTWIDAERPADQAEHHHAADAESAGADRQAAHSTAAAKAAAIAASIFDVAAFRHVIQAHCDSPSPNSAIVAGCTL
jgi:hypothetical protein